MNKNIVHEIGNYLHQIISNSEHIINNKELPTEYAQKIKDAAYSIDALITDSTVEKPKINIKKSNTEMVDFTKFSTLKIMIVDDMIENIQIMENIFNTLSCEIVSAQRGEEALEVFKNGFVPDIVCMDMIMPGLDGFTTTKELKLLGSEAYFIAISALKNQPHEMVSLFDCWLPKPFRLEHIIGALANYESSSYKKIVDDSFKFGTEISQDLKDELLHLAKNGAYSDLKKVISSLKDSPSKEFLNSALHKVDFNLVIKSIVSS